MRCNMEGSNRAKLEKDARRHNAVNPRDGSIYSPAQSYLFAAFFRNYHDLRDNRKSINGVLNDLVSVAMEVRVYKEENTQTSTVTRSKLYVQLAEKFSAYCDFMDDNPDEPPSVTDDL